MQVNDDKESGLCVRVTALRKTFYYCYEVRENGQRHGRALKLGVPQIVARPNDATHVEFTLKGVTFREALTVAGARKAVKRLKGSVDPFAELRGAALQHRKQARADKEAARQAKRQQVEDRAAAKAATVTMREAVEGYIADKAVRGKLKPTTKREYERLLSKEIAPVIGDVAVATLDDSNAMVLFKKTKDRPTTANRCQQLCSAVVNWAMDRKQAMRPRVAGNPFDGEPWHVERLTRRPLTKEEEGRLIMAMRDATEDTPTGRGGALDAIRLLHLTGWRKAEALSLRWDAIDFDSGVAILNETKTGQSILPISTAAVALLRDIQRAHPINRTAPVFVFPSPSDPTTHRVEVKRMWNHLRVVAGIQDYPLHGLRHTRATRTLAATGSIESVRVLAGHRDPRTTRRYAELEASEARKAADATDAAIAAMHETATDPAVLPFRPVGKKA